MRHWRGGNSGPSQQRRFRVRATSTRKVNQVQGEHRFGGGNDWDAMRRSLICWQGLPGDESEKTAQHNALTDHCGGTECETSPRVSSLCFPWFAAPNKGENTNEQTISRSRILLVGGMCAALPAEGATENFELNGSVYTKWLYETTTPREFSPTETPSGRMTSPGTTVGSN